MFLLRRRFWSSPRSQRRRRRPQKPTICGSMPGSLLSEPLQWTARQKANAPRFLRRRLRSPPAGTCQSLASCQPTLWVAEHRQVVVVGRVGRNPDRRALARRENQGVGRPVPSPSLRRHLLPRQAIAELFRVFAEQSFKFGEYHLLTCTHSRLRPGGGIKSASGT